ncbi:MAG: hypothetical protein AVO39_03660 [delta proteobacterium MLS_D]|jgi:tetratricopeptide (TPR) repeat protein|nr:MAG: hypothetical protein AVO39_03660 [delta proteobacterium MLS_D]
MSYILEALKRAQDEKDGRYGGYGTVIGKPERRGRRRSVIAAAAGVLAVLALAVFVVQITGTFRASTADRSPGVAAVPATEPAAVRAGERDESAAALFRLGLEHQGRGEVKQAEELYRKVLTDDAFCAPASNNLGVLCLLRGDLGEAESWFAEAAERDDSYADPWYNLACLHAGSGEEERALACLDEAVRRDGRVKSWAEHDKDFDTLRSLPAFRRVMESAGDGER